VDLENAVRTLGGSQLTTFRRVTVPLLRRSILANWLLVFVPSLRELSAAIFLFTPRTTTMTTQIFDFSEIARRSLGRYWQPLSEPQRTEFVDLFGDLLERSYISKIELYGGEKIVYSGERVDADLATVSTRIMTKNGTEVPVDYRLFKRGDRWMIYDVSVEGISLVSNYRTQFNKIIQTTSYNGLVSKLRNKQDELLAEDKGGKKKP